MNKQHMFLTALRYLSLRKYLSSLVIYLRQNKLTFLLILILGAGFLFRTYNINWDNGHYFHPDERAIIMFATPLKLPVSFDEFLSQESPLNPRFFAYGNFPLYLLKILAQLLSVFDEQLSQYGYIHFIGRFISAIFDTATIFLVFLLGRRLKNASVGIMSAFSYAIFVFPIQTSHFFAVDTMLTFFLIATLLSIQSWTTKSTPIHATLTGLFFGLALATKISALIFAPVLLLGLIIAISHTLSKRNWRKKVSLFLNFLIIMMTTIIVFFATQPYTLIDLEEFVKQTTHQSQMSKDPFLFPYTLQYVGKIPYLHELNNIIFFGIGLPLSLFAIFGVIILTLYFALKKHYRNPITITTLLYFWVYFIAFGSFAVGWMRYMLPIYPIFAVSAGLLLVTIYSITRNKIQFLTLRIGTLLLLGIFLLYPMSFLSIYQKPNTRVQATAWIFENIPIGSSIAVEHWDDALPIHGAHSYTMVTLPLYEPDSEQKWSMINSNLAISDYLIIASNRLYAPLQRMTDCSRLPSGRCYTITANYYEELFSEKRGFKKIAEFTEFPTIPFTNIQLNDQRADESFTVYDHPRIFIFKKAE